MQVSPTQDQAIEALRQVLALAVPVPLASMVLGQANRVPPPSATDYIVITPLRRTRIETNTDSSDDCRLVGSVSGNVLTVTSITFGSVTIGRTLWAVGGFVSTITGQLTGPTGGIGTYSLADSGTVSAGTVMGCGATDILAPYELDLQIDVHGAGGSSNASDYAQLISALLRDDWAIQQFAAQIASVIPLHADDPRFIPGFVDGEQQYEDRWVVEARLQVNAVISVPQQFADSLAVGIIDVDSEYPA